MRKEAKQIFRNLILVIFSLITSVTISRAEDVELEKIVVTPSRIAESYGSISRNVDVITAKDIQNSGAQDLSEVLTSLTSVNITNYGGLGAQKSIKMRGSTASQVLVLMDGRPINNPRDGQTDLTSVPLENIERIEVMHGPGSSLYGSSAMGGTINIITKKPTKEKQKTQLFTSFGTFRTYTEQLVHTARISKLGYLISGGYQESEGFRDNSNYDAKDFNTKLEYDFNNENILTLSSGFYTSKVGTPGSIDTPDLDDKQKKRNNFLSLDWGLRPDDTLELSTKIYGNYDRLEFMENTAGSTFDTAFRKDIHTTKVRGIDLQLNKQLLNIYRIICGFNYVTNHNDSTSSAKHKYIVRAGYLENQLDLTQKLKINFGARVDDYSNFGTQPNPSISFLYKFSPDFKLRTSVSRSFRAPTFNDLYWPDQGSSRGNPNLEPEKGITAEFGIEKRLNKYISSNLTYYRSDYNNLIIWAPERTVSWVQVRGVWRQRTTTIWQPTNINSAIIDGIEFENKINLTNNLEWDLNYTYLHAKDDKLDKYLTYQPKYKVDSSFKYKTLNGFMFELKGQFTDKRFSDTQNDVYVKRFFLLGLNVSKKFKHGFTYFLSIDNLLNKEYQVVSGYPMPGTSVNSGLKLEF